MMSKSPFLEIGDLVLRLADDDLDDGLVEPGRLRFEPRGFFASAARAVSSAVAAASARLASPTARTCRCLRLPAAE